MALVLTAAAQEMDFDAIRATKVASAVRITEEINIDGRLEEPVWALAIPATDFTQRIPRLGAPPTDPTEIRFLYDEDKETDDFESLTGIPSIFGSTLMEDHRGIIWI